MNGRVSDAGIWLKDIKTQLRQQSRPWRQLRNQIVLNVDGEDASDSLMALARTQVKDLINESIPKMV